MRAPQSARRLLRLLPGADKVELAQVEEFVLDPGTEDAGDLRQERAAVLDRVELLGQGAGPGSSL